MSGKDFTFWMAVKEFQKELEQLKQDMERVNAIRRELDEIEQRKR